MAKVITFSRTFPASHPRKGAPTYFVEKLYNSIYGSKTGDWSDAPGTVSNYVVELNHLIKEEKHHTIRSGNRWKAGDYFSPRIWSDKPYSSRQIIIAPDILIEKIFEFEMDENGVYSINGKYTDEKTDELLAQNDGLTDADMQFWFMPNINKPKAFKGQIICWNDKINY